MPRSLVALLKGSTYKCTYLSLNLRSSPRRLGGSGGIQSFVGLAGSRTPRKLKKTSTTLDNLRKRLGRLENTEKMLEDREHLGKLEET